MAEYFSYTDVNDYLYYRIVKVTDSRSRDILFWKRWDLPFGLVVKYEWYFRYIAAIQQIKFPKAEVNLYRDRVLKKPEDLEKNKANKIRARKAKITEMKNKLARAYKLAEKELFPIDDHPHIIKFKERLAASEVELERLQNVDVMDLKN